MTLLEIENFIKEFFLLNLYAAIEQCYRTKPFTSDEERLEYLFKMYEDMTSKEGQ